VRIAFLHPCYWPEVQRGAERVLRELATDLIGMGHSPRLVTSHPGPPHLSVEDGLRITRHWRPPEGPLVHRGAQEHLTHLPFSWLSLVRGRDDVLHAHFPTDAALASRFSARTGVPSVFTYHGNPERAVLSSRRWRMRVATEALYGCDAVVAPSRAAADGLRRWFGVEARVVYPGVRLDDFSMTDGRDERPTILCAAAADDPRKRVPLLLSAFRRVRRVRPAARLLLVRPRDRGAARELEDDGVELLPPDPAVIASVYRRVWVSALAARNEAFGLVLVEALACGTPVVGPSDGGVPEIIDRDEIGRMFDGGEADLARALLDALELAQDEGTPARCRERAGAFTTERTARDYEAVYLEILGGGAHRDRREPAA
jgi:glycosyltransferase involved in cell wall biosynthesis